ncbi:MAG: hypothetical protein K2J99_18270 [Lachnospiraceae bacterium]|nr:hypothetical protein [Lachnospiraceae bacterium]
MFKRLLTMALSITMVLGAGTTAFAADKENDTPVVAEENAGESITMDELLEQLNSIDFGREVTFTALPQSRLDDQEMLNFDSVEDAEEYLRQFMTEPKELTTGTFGQSQALPLVDTKSPARSNPAGWYTTTVWWWGGGNTSLLSNTNAEIKFYYNGSDVSNISVTNSYMTGIVGATWTHRSGTGTPLGGKDAKFSVTGTWYVGISIGGFPVGSSFNETLTSPTITINV